MPDQPEGSHEPEPRTSGLKQLNVLVPPELLARVRAHAAERGITITEVVKRALAMMLRGGGA